MMSWWWLGAAWAGDLPELDLEWRRRTVSIALVAPKGEHLQPDAPVSGFVQVGSDRFALETTGERFEGGAVLPRGDADQVRVELRVGLCEDGGTTCRIVDVAYVAQTSGRKGSARLQGVQPEGPVADAGGAVEVAFARAKAEGKLVLLDFTAVWCPPCNLMAAEVFEDPTDAPALAPFVLVAVDADTPESWPWKDRYEVQGYPTVVALRPDGTEVDRQVGYGVEAEFKRFLGQAAQEQLALGALPAAETLTPEEAAVIAGRLARAQRPEAARPYVDRADGVQSVEAAWARLVVREEPASALWLAQNASDRVLEWLWPASDLAETDAEVRAALLSLCDARLATAAPLETADLLYVKAQLSPEPDRPALYAEAASRIEATLTGDAARDRGMWTFLSDLFVKSGDPESARALLQAAVEAYPAEFTFHHALAGFLQQQGELAPALDEAFLAARFGYGDNALRASERVAGIMVAMGMKAEAAGYLDAVLADVVLPPDDLEVRTHRYVTKLRELRASLEAPPAP